MKSFKMLIFLTFPNFKLRLFSSYIYVFFSPTAFLCYVCQHDYLVMSPCSDPLSWYICESVFYVSLSFLFRYATWLLKFVTSELSFWCTETSIITIEMSSRAIFCHMSLPHMFLYPVSHFPAMTWPKSYSFTIGFRSKYTHRHTHTHTYICIHTHTYHYDFP